MSGPVFQSSFPSESEVARIVALPDPAARNRQITEAYWKLSTEVDRRILGDANWCTFATWASRQAGVTIRHEDLTDVLRDRLRNSLKIRGIIGKLIGILEEGGLDLFQLVVDSVSNLGPLKRSAKAVARGNRKVFEEIGLQFARWLTLFADIRSITDAEMDSFCLNLTPGQPPEGQDLLRKAFGNYRAAARATDDKENAELMLLANLQIGFHEQMRLQPDIQAALDGAVLEPRDLADPLMNVLALRQGRISRILRALWPFRESPLEKLTMALAREVQEEVRMLSTEQLMSLSLPPGEVVQLGRDLTRPFPAILQTLTNPDLLELLAGVGPIPDTERGSHVKDWADFKDRIRFIADLFRAYRDDQHLFDTPFVADATGAGS